MARREPTGKEACVAAGAVPEIVAVLKAHPNYAALAEKACQALWLIAQENLAGQQACVTAGAVPLLCAAFSDHSGETRRMAHGALNAMGYTEYGSKI